MVSAMTDGATPSSWYAVRCILVAAENKPWGPTDLELGEAAYEERITLWRAASMDAAIALAEADAEEYAEDLESEYAGLAQCYRFDGEPEQGAEVFSLIRRSRLEPDDYIDRFFETGGECQQPAITD